MSLQTEQLVSLVNRDGSVGALLARQAREMPEKALLLWRGAAFSYGEVDQRAGAAARALVECGVGPGDRVAIMMTNCPEWIFIWLALAKLGAVAVTLNPAYKGEGLAYLINDSRPRALVIDAEFIPRFEALGDAVSLPPVFVRGDLHPGPIAARSVEVLLKGGNAPLPEVSLIASSPCSIIYTSGTTGAPKGCLLPQGQYLASAHVLADNCQYNGDSVLYTCLPLFHINAQNYALVVAIAAGATLALDDRFSASRFWDRLIDVRATAFSLIGSMAVSLFNRPPHPAERQHSAKIALGAPVPLNIWEEWEKRFGVRVVYAYGMTENGLPTIFPFKDTPAAPHLRGAGGKASAMSEVMVVDEHDLPVPPGQRGEILTRPALPFSMMTEYVGRPEATVEVFRNCWFHTGDIGVIDEEGYLFYVDRKKDALRRKGEMVSSWEVESVVSKFPGVAECAVVGVPSPMGEDEVLVAIVCEGNPFDPAELIGFCRERTAAHQIPRYVRFVESLPRTQTERIEKFRIRDVGVTVDTWDAEAQR